MIDPEDEREEFVSIRELVGLIAASKGKSEQQAAAMLLCTLAKHEAWARVPLYEWTPTYGCREITEPNSRQENKVIARLSNWAQTGSSLPTFAEQVDDFGEIPF
jgi:hypothetical protein